MKKLKAVTHPVILYDISPTLVKYRTKAFPVHLYEKAQSLLKLYFDGNINEDVLSENLGEYLTNKLLTHKDSYFCRKTYAFLLLEDGRIVLSQSSQNPLDKFSRREGRKIALKRLSNALKGINGDTEGNVGFFKYEVLATTFADTKLLRTIKWQLDLREKQIKKLENLSNRGVVVAGQKLAKETDFDTLGSN